MQKKTPEQQAAEAAAKEAERAEATARKDATQQEKQRKAFFESPIGQARAAFERNDVIFQCSVDVMSNQQESIIDMGLQVIIAAVGGSVAKQPTDDTGYVLNQICYEGWELVTGSFVFVQQELASRDNVMSPGQTASISGKTVGYYLFKRCPESRKEIRYSWEIATSAT